MITKEEMKQFLNWPAVPQKRVLSVYLNIESSGDGVLHRRFEGAFKLLMQSLEKGVKRDPREELEEDANRARQFISGYQSKGRGLVLWVDDSEGFFWVKELNVHVANQAYWLEKPYVLPLLEAFDEYERYGVILADKGRARVFTYCLGEIEEEKAALAWNDVQHIRTAGQDNIRSASKLQKTAEMHVEWHLKHVVELVEELVKRLHFDRLILGGSKEAVNELSELLPQALQLKVSGKLSLPVNVHEKQLREDLEQLENQIEREAEAKLVQQFMQTNPADKRRVVGLDAVLVHLNKGPIHQLIYSETFKPQGGYCRGCGHLFSTGRMMCGRCGSAIEAQPHLLEEVARAAVQKGGSLEVVRGEAARELDKAGGIGAILKEEKR